jgi:hypothetical protein
MALVSALALALGACARSPDSPEAVASRERAAPPRLVAYDCEEGLALVVTLSGDGRRAEARWADQARGLGRVAGGGSRSGGARYEGEGSSLELREEGARLVGGGVDLRCRRGARATSLERWAAEGALVFGVGNEPGWSLVLFPDRFVWDGDYGESHEEARVEARAVSDGACVYRAAGARAIRIERRLCRDAMSGAPFAAEVTVTRGAETYRGCGLYLGGVAPSCAHEDETFGGSASTGARRVETSP